jgi:PTS system nitrogen regulatory IIA component
MAVDEATRPRARPRPEPNGELALRPASAYLSFFCPQGPGVAPLRRRMNDLPDILTSDAIDEHLAAANKKALFQQLAAAASRRTGLATKTIVTALAEREKIGSTGFGAGIAIPHAKVGGLDRVIGYFARLAAPIDFQAVDGLPVDLVFMILSPTDSGADHLKALAGVSRALRDRNLTAKLRGARSRDAIFALLAGIESLHAA